MSVDKEVLPWEVLTQDDICEFTEYDEEKMKLGKMI